MANSVACRAPSARSGAAPSFAISRVTSAWLKAGRKRGIASPVDARRNVSVCDGLGRVAEWPPTWGRDRLDGVANMSGGSLAS